MTARPYDDAELLDAMDAGGPYDDDAEIAAMVSLTDGADNFVSAGTAAALRPYEVLCEDTSKLPRSEWLKLRKLGVGSSDAAASLGLSHWKSQYNLWAEKRGLLEDEADNDRFLMGRTFEEPVLRLYCARFGVPFESIQRHLMLRSTTAPWMLANPDGLTEDTVYEVKTCELMDKPRWDYQGVPDVYEIQALHLMAVTRRKRCVFPVCFGWSMPVEIVVEWNEENGRAITTVEGEFWRRVDKNDPPDPDASDSSAKALREVYRAKPTLKTVDIGPNGLKLIEAKEIAADQIKPLEERIGGSKNLLMKLLGEADAEGGTITVEGREVVVVTWKADKNGNRRLYFPERAA